MSIQELEQENWAWLWALVCCKSKNVEVREHDQHQSVENILFDYVKLDKSQI